MDHLPPPPYSETDIYSNFSSEPNVILTPGTSRADTAVLASASPRSSIDEPIYTPPFTPTGSVYQDNGSSASAAAYFDSRPSHIRTSGPPTIHSIAVTATTAPRDLPYPQPVEDFFAKDLTQQDWATFVNYLLPDYAGSTNNSVADRKLKAELVDDRMQRLTLEEGDRSNMDLSQVTAQLGILRSPTTRIADSEFERKVRVTIETWNDGFFTPRGIKIRLVGSELGQANEAREVTNGMPGAWIPYEHETTEGAPSRDNNPRTSWGLGNLMRADARGFKMGPIEANDSGFRMGNMLV
jgi:hypothetical protein